MNIFSNCIVYVAYSHFSHLFLRTQESFCIWFISLISTSDCHVINHCINQILVVMVTVVFIDFFCHCEANLYIHSMSDIIVIVYIHVLIWMHIYYETTYMIVYLIDSYTHHSIYADYNVRGQHGTLVQDNNAWLWCHQKHSVH